MINRLDLDLGLPKGAFTPIKPDADAYEVFEQKLEDLMAVGAGREVKVINPVIVQGEVELHVSCEGNDNNNGSSEAPFRTVKKALGCIKMLQKQGVNGIVIYLHEGVYLSSDFSLDATHSGSSYSPVIISAYNNESVVISGGRDISGSNFTKVTDVEILKRLQISAREHIFVVDLRELGITELGRFSRGRFGGPGFSVSMNGELLTLARYPDATTIPLGEVLDDPVANPNSTGVEYIMKDSRPKLWHNDGNIWRYGNLGGEWYKVHNRVAEINAASNTIKLEGGDIRSATMGDHYYYNVLEELSVPGEYYLDFAAGKLYLYPIGEMSKSVITFTATGEDLVRLNGVENVVLNGLIIENGGSHGIWMDNCKNTLIQNCVIRNVDTGIKISGKNSGIIYSEICKTKDRPVYMGNADVKTYDFSEPEHNFVQNCYVYSTGMVSVSNTPIYVAGIQNVVSHNLIQGTNAVSIQLSLANECIIEYNEIVGGPNGVYDYGSVYCAGANTGNHIRYNYIHDTARHSKKGYLDEGTRGYFVYGNIMKNVQDGIYLHFGSDNVLVNNIVMSEREGRKTTPIWGNDKMATYTIADRFARSENWKSYYDMWLAMSEDAKMTFKQRYPNYSRLWEEVKEAINVAGGNMNTGIGRFMAEGNCAKNNIVVFFEGLQFEGRNHTVSENAVLSVDPFVDAENNNYSLKDDITLGFEYQEIDMNRVGILVVQKDGIAPFSLYAPSNGFDKVDPHNVLLKWTLSGGADTYHLKIGTNAELTENVREFTVEHNSCFFDWDEYFVYDKNYYWSVVANTTAKSRIQCPTYSSVFSFKTMTEDEYFEFNEVSFDTLNQMIEVAEQFSTEMVEQSLGGIYYDGSRAALKTAIDNAEALIKNGTKMLQTVIDEAVVELENCIIKARASREIRHITFEELDATEWKDLGSNSVTSVVEGQALCLINTSGNRKESVYRKGLGTRDILCFKYKVEEKRMWHGFALAQTKLSSFITNGSDGYFIAINPNHIELQKYQCGVKVARIDVPNDRSVFIGGEYHDIEIGAINYEDGSVGLHFKINDKVIFNPEVHRDTKEDEALPGRPIAGVTGFGVVVNNINGKTYLMKADTQI